MVPDLRLLKLTLQRLPLLSISLPLRTAKLPRLVVKANGQQIGCRTTIPLFGWAMDCRVAPMVGTMLLDRSIYEGLTRKPR